MFPLTAIPWRLIGVGAGVAAVALLGWRVNTWHAAYKELPSVKEALKREEGCLPDSKCNERQKAAAAAQKVINDQTVKDYEKKLADIAARPAPAGPVRLCRPRSAGGVRVPGPAAPTSPSAGSDVPVEVGRDIAVELSRLADDADTEALKLRELWNRDVALSQPPKQQGSHP